MAKLTQAQIKTVNGARYHLQELAEVFTKAAEGDAEAQRVLVSCASVLAADTKKQIQELDWLAYPATMAFITAKD